MLRTIFLRRAFGWALAAYKVIFAFCASKKIVGRCVPCWGKKRKRGFLFGVSGLKIKVLMFRV